MFVYATHFAARVINKTATVGDSVTLVCITQVWQHQWIGGTNVTWTRMRQKLLLTVNSWMETKFGWQ